LHTSIALLKNTHISVVPFRFLNKRIVKRRKEKKEQEKRNEAEVYL
jgi:hypothetical protein